MEDRPFTYPGWQVVRAIGTGSCGRVYEIKKDSLFGDTDHSALKVISLPASAGDLQTFYDEMGLDEKSVASLLSSQVEDITTEINLMSHLKGNSHIVSYEDYNVVPHTDGPGWDIFIRMELLTPLAAHLRQTWPAADADIDEALVLRVGLDLCRALEVCERHNILHRDIKPQNIFLNREGSFKLGDFGIAKTADHTTTGTRTGTFTYMAPEVYTNKPYNASVDIYSLGLVLYWMLNRRRGPFLPLPPQVPTAADASAALEKRNSGVPLPPPCGGSPALQAIVLKAAAFAPEARYTSATEMLRDLEAAAGGAAPQALPSFRRETAEAPANETPAPETPALTSAPEMPAPQNDAAQGGAPGPGVPEMPDLAVGDAPAAPEPPAEPLAPPAPPRRKGSRVKLGLGIACLAAAVVLAVGLLRPKPQPVTAVPEDDPPLGTLNNIEDAFLGVMEADDGNFSSYVTRSFNGADREMSELPCRMEVHPQWDGYMFLTFPDRYDTPYCLYGTYQIVGDTLFINPADTLDLTPPATAEGETPAEGAQTASAEETAWPEVGGGAATAPLTEQLRFDVELYAPGFWLRTEKESERMFVVHRGTAMQLAGSADSDADVYEEIQSLVVDGTILSDSGDMTLRQADVLFSDGGHANVNKATCYSRVGGLFLYWDDSVRAYNGRMETVTQHDSLSIDYIDNAPYGFTIVGDYDDQLYHYHQPPLPTP